MKYLGNAFSLQMIELGHESKISVRPCAPSEVTADAVSCIGHVDTAAVVSSILGWEVPANRISVKLATGDVLYVAQLIGGRLPEGSTSLPEGFSLQFVKVELE